MTSDSKRDPLIPNSTHIELFGTRIIVASLYVIFKGFQIETTRIRDDSFVLATEGHSKDHQHVESMYDILR